MRPKQEVELVTSLAEAGLSQKAIAKQTGIPRATVRGWLNGRQPRGRSGGCFQCEGRATDEKAYAYLLGQYLGDGCLSVHRREIFRLRITCCAAYAGIMFETVRALECVLPRRVGVVEKIGCYEVGSYSKHWVCLFPQHGPGRKHERRIELHGWQREIVGRQPEALIRGLIHSDGCRCINMVGVYQYPRYFFSNNSLDIQRIFTDALDQLGIGWRNNRWNSVSIARRADVAKLDAFVGPKA